MLVTGTAGKPWWNDTTFYEIFVRSFYDSDGDGVGDLNGLIEKLDYLNDGDPATTSDLGVTGIWLMPVMASPSYHGYDITDYYQVNPEYGTSEDFKRLIAEAHKRGIRVIIDLVLNHTSSEHPWFSESQNPNSPKRAWYVWSAEEPQGKGWHPGKDGGYYYGYFGERMPDLNYKNPRSPRRCTRSSASGWRRWAPMASGSTRSSICTRMAGGSSTRRPRTNGSRTSTPSTKGSTRRRSPWARCGMTAAPQPNSG